MSKNHSLSNLFTLVGVITVVATAVFFVLRYFDKRAHEEKWKDYFECGIS